jgi:hypothetical protein
MKAFYERYVFIYWGQMSCFDKGKELFLRKGCTMVGEYLTTRKDFGLCVRANNEPAAWTLDKGTGGRICGELWKVTPEIYDEIVKYALIPGVSAKVRVKLFGFKSKVVTFMMAKPPLTRIGLRVLDKASDHIYDWKRISGRRAETPKSVERPGDGLNDKTLDTKLTRVEQIVQKMKMEVASSLDTNKPPFDTTKKQEEKTTMTAQAAKEPAVPCVYNPIKTVDGKEINRNTYTFKLLELIDQHDYIFSEASAEVMTPEDRGAAACEIGAKLRQQVIAMGAAF